MTTELQRQVALHRERNIAPRGPIHHGAPSLFLDAKEVPISHLTYISTYIFPHLHANTHKKPQAAKVDMKEVWESALKGAETLSQYDPRVNDYSHILLDESSITLQRELKTKQENKEIDKLIQKLLNLLTLYASSKSTHLILEYLIR